MGGYKKDEHKRQMIVGDADKPTLQEIIDKFGPLPRTEDDRYYSKRAKRGRLINAMMRMGGDSEFRRPALVHRGETLQERYEARQQEGSDER